MRAKKARKVPRYLADETSILANLNISVKWKRLKQCWEAEVKNRGAQARHIIILICSPNHETDYIINLYM